MTTAVCVIEGEGEKNEINIQKQFANTQLFTRIQTNTWIIPYAYSIHPCEDGCAYIYVLHLPKKNFSSSTYKKRTKKAQPTNQLIQKHG